MGATVNTGDCLAWLRSMPDNSVDSIVTDPPYGLSNIKPRQITEAITAWASGDRERVPDGRGFMGKDWDSFVPPPAVWDECLRALKPGGHLVAFAGSRTHDLMGLSIRMAGFEIRDGLAWLYGSGFPKSMDVSKAIDKLDAAEERRSRALEFTAWIRECGLTAGQIDKATGTNMGSHFTTAATQPAVATADLFDKLRPLLPEVPERIEELVAQRTVESQNFKAREVVGTRIAHDARKSRLGFTGPTYGGTGATREIELTTAHTPEAQQWAGWGTAPKPAFEPVTLARKPLEGTVAANVLKWGTGALNIDGCRIAHRNEADLAESAGKNRHADFDTKAGGNKVYGDYSMVERTNYDGTKGRWPANVILDESQAAALDEQSGVSKSSIGKPRGASHGDGWGMTQTGAEYDDAGGASRFFYCAKAGNKERPVAPDGTRHPTVKPLALMRWLVRLVTPPGGTVLDPFAGSGSTLEAAVLEGFDVVGVERESRYIPLIEQRLERASNSPSLDI